MSTTTTTAAAATTATTAAMKFQQITKEDISCEIPAPFLFIGGFALLFLIPNNEPLL